MASSHSNGASLPKLQVPAVADIANLIRSIASTVRMLPPPHLSRARTVSPLPAPVTSVDSRAANFATLPPHAPHLQWTLRLLRTCCGLASAVDLQVQMGSEASLVALAYVERLVSVGGVRLDAATWQRITLTALLLAHKVRRELQWKREEWKREEREREQ